MDTEGYVFATTLPRNQKRMVVIFYAKQKVGEHGFELLPKMRLPMGDAACITQSVFACPKDSKAVLLSLLQLLLIPLPLKPPLKPPLKLKLCPPARYMSLYLFLL